MDKLIYGIIVLLSFSVISSDKGSDGVPNTGLNSSEPEIEIQADSASLLNKLIELPTEPKECLNNTVDLPNMPVFIPDSSLTKSMPIYIPPPVDEEMIIPFPGGKTKCE
jgi:hypothetical protein